MAGANLGPEYDLAKRISDLESIVRGLQTRDVLQNASIGAGGLTILNGGSLTVDGNATFNGSLTVPAGSLNTGGNLTAGGSITAGTALVGASLNVSGAASASSLTVGTVAATQLNASSGINSVGVYATDVSLLPGARQPVWQNNNGTMGYAPSTLTKKANLSPVPFSATDVLAVTPTLYQYIGQLDIRDNPDNPNYDPDYEVPWDLGFIAEQLIEHGLRDFVVFAEDGETPVTIDYGGFGAVASLVVLQEHEARLQAAGL